MEQADLPVPVEEDAFPQSELKRLERRRWILKLAKRGGTGAEFGVFRGHFSAVIARELSPEKFFLVDPWTLAGEKFNWGDIPYTNFNKLTSSQALLDTQRRMARFEDISEVHYVESTLEEFCTKFSSYSSEFLDFVYLDTSHTYEDTLSQLTMINMIIKKDGVILGDDWQPDTSNLHHGVFRAVNDFIRLNSYQIVAAGPAGQFCLRQTPDY